MGYTVAIVLRMPRVEGGLCTVNVRITADRKQTYVNTGVRVLPANWDSKTQTIVGVPGAAQLNVMISTTYNQVLQNINRSKMDEKQVTAKAIRNAFVEKDKQNIFNFSEKYSEDVTNKREKGTLNNYERHMRKLEEFNKSRNLNFDEMDVTYLQSYEKWIRKHKVKYKGVERPVNNNYVFVLLKAIRTMFNAALKQGIITETPFKTYEFPIYKPPIKDYLSMKELERWEKFVDETTNKSLKQAGTYFLLGCYTGLRVSDWFRFNIDEHTKDKGTRVLLRAKKNGEWVGMKISRPLARNLERMKLLPLTIEEQTINEKLKVIAVEVKIYKDLTTHSGRHTFAITLCAERGMSAENCAALMGITIKTCIDSYYRVTREKLDSATDTAWSDLE